MKKFKVYWDEVIIHHRVAEVEANNKSEVARLVKDLKINGNPDPNNSDDFGKVINGSIKVIKEDK